MRRRTRPFIQLLGISERTIEKKNQHLRTEKYTVSDRQPKAPGMKCQAPGVRRRSPQCPVSEARHLDENRGQHGSQCVSRNLRTGRPWAASPAWVPRPSVKEAPGQGTAPART